MSYTIEELEKKVEREPVQMPLLLGPGKGPAVTETEGGVIITDMLGGRRFFPRPDLHLGGVR